MRRKNSFKAHNRSYKRAKSRTRAINSPQMILRGGRRL